MHHSVSLEVEMVVTAEAAAAVVVVVVIAAAAAATVVEAAVATAVVVVVEVVAAAVVVVVKEVVVVAVFMYQCSTTSKQNRQTTCIHKPMRHTQLPDVTKICQVILTKLSPLHFCASAGHKAALHNKLHCTLHDITYSSSLGSPLAQELFRVNSMGGPWLICVLHN